VQKAFRNETEFIQWLLKRVPGKARGLRLGIGDDAALVEVGTGQGVILKSDMSLENVHFKRRLHPPRSVGHRALARPLSDVAAMGGTPRFALVSLALSRTMPQAWTKGFYAGLLELAARFGVTLVGGDVAVVSGPTLIDTVVTGEVAPGKELQRCGAKPGDQIFVSGELGLAALGLRVLRSKVRFSGACRPRSAVWRARALQAQLYPEPQCELGRFLSAENLASAAIDLSDGLSTDLMHLCRASGVGAKVWEELLPLPQAPTYPRWTLKKLAFHGGEDYQLLFTVPRGKRPPAFFGDLALRRIGHIRRSREEVLLVARDGRPSLLRPAGYDHLRDLV
jgi:thiamine-monophosphate kinase